MDPVTILIVDDDEVLAQVLQRVLSRQGHTVLQAGTVAQARQMAREHRPQLGLLDLTLPDGDGVELAEQFEADGLHFPLILITAYPLRLREHPELSSRFVRVLTKPLNLQELRQAVDTALGGTTTAPTAPVAPAPAVQSPLPLSAPVPETYAVNGSPAPSGQRRLIWAGVGALAVLLLVGVLAAGPALGLPNVASFFKGSGEGRPSYAPTQPRVVEQRVEASLVPNVPDAIEVPPDVVKRLNVQTKPVVEAYYLQPLDMAGSLALDTDKLAIVRTRFPGEVVELGKHQGRLPSGISGPEEPIRFFDHVREGDLLFVVWSRDLGDKKSDLRDALSQLDFDQETLDKQEALWKEGATTEAVVRTAWRQVQADKIAVERAKSTLRAWRLTEKEIDDIVKESQEFIRLNKDPRKREVAKGSYSENWARVEVRVPSSGDPKNPFEGVILEKNVQRGMMVDPSVDLLKVGDVRRLIVWANVYEEDLATLQKLKTEAEKNGQELAWTVYLKGDPDAIPMKGALSRIGQVIDPTQHSALVMGWVDNPDERLRSGQFISASVSRPAPPNTVYVPASAVLEDGQESVVFVKLPGDTDRYALRRVRVLRRYSDRFLLYRDPRWTPANFFATTKAEPINPGEEVVVQSNLLLRAALKDLQDKREDEPKPGDK
jgi:cobalt-zinc-cadmium efflux system membrane fusion protein